MKKVAKLFLHIIFFLILTILTQVGGVIYVVIILIHQYFRFSFLFGSLIFILSYLLGTFVFIPLIASEFGRAPLPLSGPLRPLNIMACVLNRHYVNSDFKEVAIGAAIEMKTKYPDAAIRYLDANFPFWDEFPLFPHLSHDDGKKLDLAFYYTHNGEVSNSAPSPIGYGVFVDPEIDEVNYPEICRQKGFWQYGAIAYLVPDWWEEGYKVDPERTKFLVQILVEIPATSRIFIEPHLKQRWNLDNAKIRFHGCHAVRHDDHIHWQVE